MSDLIDRQMAIDVLNRGLSKIPYVNNTDTEMIRRDERVCCIQEIRWVPTAEAEPEWIPCSKKLPEYEEYVLVTFIDKSAIDTNVMCVRRIEGFVDWYWSDFADEYTWEASEVVAWTPLPDPWREGEE